MFSLYSDNSCEQEDFDTFSMKRFKTSEFGSRKSSDSNMAARIGLDFEYEKY